MKATTKLFALALVLAGTSVFSQTANEVAKAENDLADGKTSSSSISITLIDKSGKTRSRELVSYEMKDGNTDKTLMVFKTPKDVAGVGYLSFDYPDKPDGSPTDGDSWLYLPAMKKVRRVAGSNKDDDFQGTDFTYDDIGKRSLGKDNFALLGDEKIGGKDYWILEPAAKDQRAKISRRVSWIDKETYVTLKREYYDRQNQLLKTLSCENIQKISGYWTTQKYTMKNVQTNHQTVMERISNRGGLA